MKIQYLITDYMLTSARAAVIIVATFAMAPSALAQETARWFQVEISIFSYTNFNPDAELWQAIREAPTLLPSARPLIRMSEELALSTWSEEEEPVGELSVREQRSDNVIDQTQNNPVQTGPAPFRTNNNFRLPDIERDAFVVLPASEHDFLDTNRTLERSPSHRLLFHAAWRQPVRQAAGSTAIMVSGGSNVGDNNDMEGSVRFRFNPNEDRVVIDAHIWVANPVMAATDEHPFIQFIQSRDMRSNEFHYLDHPALGILVQVKPYTVPPLETTTDVNADTTVPAPPQQ